MESSSNALIIVSLFSFSPFLLVDGDGHIEKDELCAMLMEVCLSNGMNAGYEETYEASEKVLTILDNDNSGSIEPDEL